MHSQRSSALDKNGQVLGTTSPPSPYGGLYHEKAGQAMNGLQVIEHKNQRVLTTVQLAELYETERQIITNNFNRNKDRYEEGRHYFFLEGETLKEFKAINQIDFLQTTGRYYIWTERGALLHAKSLNTDRAWEVYEYLLETYFKTQKPEALKLPKTYKEALLALVAAEEEKELLQAQAETLQIENKAMLPKAETYDDFVARGYSTCFRTTAKEIGVPEEQLISFLLEHKYIYREDPKIKNGKKKPGKLMPYAEFVKQGWFAIKDTVSMRSDWAGVQTLVTFKGKEHFKKLLRKEAV
jgi:phage antirepressor YoqD-like protein